MPSINWSDLFFAGSVVDLEVSLWRPFVRIKPEDLGIEDTPDVNRALSLGRHRLAPAKAMEDIALIAGQAKRSLEYHSLQFAMIRGARYVPNAALRELLGKLREYRRQFNDAVGAFCDRYEAVKAEQLPIIERALQGAARTPEAAAAAFIRVQAEYPDVGTVRAKFGISWKVYAIQSAKNAAAKEAAEDEAGNVKDVIRSMIEQLRGEVAERLKAMTDTISKGGKLPKGSIDATLAALDRVDSMNVMGDTGLRKQTEALRAMLLSDAENGPGMAETFTKAQTELTESVATAVKEAEERLTGVGRRKFGKVPGNTEQGGW